jgi:UDP-GlcNAc:undecaprenyl-phosphate/decaprenyl-phosphate GlcNAc-1-phosphate transferase
MIFLISLFILLILSIFLFFKKFSSLINTYDIPNERKLHKEKISLAGGVYIFICTFFYLILVLTFYKSKAEIFFNITTEYLNFFIISFIFFLIGFFDDKKNLSSNIKIAFFFILILFSVSIDPNLNVKVLRFSFTEDKIILQNFSIIFTIFSIFIFINALNMYDGSNGQLGIYVLVFILYLSFKIGSLFTLNLALPIIFFIYLNVKNLTFAGNSGSYFLGYFLSYIVLKIHNQTDFLTSDEIVLIMFYPVLDLVRLFFYRVINNKNPLSADRNHIHHILQEKKYNNKKIQFILLLIICFPIIVYELTNINIILIFLMKFFFYYIIVSKKFIFLK